MELADALSRLNALREAEVAALQQLPIDERLPRAVQLIHRRVHHAGGKVVTSGMGKAGQIGVHIATTLSSTGTPAIFLHPAEAQHGDLGLLQPHDVLLLISNSGKTREILELVDLAQALQPEVPHIVLTGHPDTPLGRRAQHVLHTGNPTEICPLGLTPTTSTTTMKVIGDLMAVLLMDLIKFDKAEYARRHHSGYLGQKARGEEGQ